MVSHGQAQNVVVEVEGVAQHDAIQRVHVHAGLQHRSSMKLQNHPGDNIKASGTSQKWPCPGMPPDSGGILRGCPLLGGAICRNVVSRVVLRVEVQNLIVAVEGVAHHHPTQLQGYLSHKKPSPP